MPSPSRQTTVVRSSFTAPDLGLLVVLSVMWGMSFLFIKVALDAVAPLWIVASRCVVGAAVLVVVLRIRGVRLPRGRRIWCDLAFLGALGNVVPWGLMAVATQHLPTGLVAVVNALAPTSTLLIAAVAGLERLTVRRVVGLLVALVGTTVAVSSDLGAAERVLAVLAVGLATVAYGIATVYAKQRVSGKHPPLAIATGQVATAMVLSVPVALVAAPAPDLGAVTPAIVASLLALGLFGTGMAFLAFYTLVERVGPTSAILVTYLIPVVALLAGAVVLGEALTVVVVVGTALTIGGVYLAQRERAPTSVEALEQVAR